MRKKRTKRAIRSATDLRPVIERFRDASLLVVGDLILDHYVWGKVNRISPEAPVVVVQVTEENKRPGGACNVVNNLVSLGARVKVCGVLGEDEAGRDLLRLLKDLSADTEGVIIDPGRATTQKTRVIAHAQQVVRVDREVVTPLDSGIAKQLGERVKCGFSGVRGVIVSDYAKGVVGGEIFSVFEALQQSGMLGYGKVPLVVDPKGPNFGIYRAATVIKPNRAEAEAASGLPIKDREQAIIAGKKLLEKWDCEMVLMTLGEDGMALVPRSHELGGAIEIDTVAREVFDVSGAGDTVSAVFTLALAVGATPLEAAELANYAAGIVVAEVGTVAVSAEELMEAVVSGEN